MASIRALSCATLLLSAGCLAEGIQLPPRSVDQDVPSIGELKSRIDALYTSQQSQDWRGWYLMTPPMYREHQSYQQFVATFVSPRSPKLISWEFMEIVHEAPSPWRTEHGAAVSMRLTIEKDGMEQYLSDQLDFWLFLDGEWYWRPKGWSGKPSAKTTG